VSGPVWIQPIMKTSDDQHLWRDSRNSNSCEDQMKLWINRPQCHISLHTPISC